MLHSSGESDKPRFKSELYLLLVFFCPRANFSFLLDFLVCEVGGETLEPAFQGSED